MIKKAALAAMATAFSIGAVTADAREISYASFLPPTYATLPQAMEPFFERVTKASNGEITFKTFYGGAMGGPKDILDNISNNTVDSGGIVDAYIRSAIPTAAMYSLFGVSTESELDVLALSAAVMEELFLNCPDCRKEFDQNNTILLSMTATAPYHIMCVPKVETLADLQGKKVRAVSTAGALMKQMGAVPVAITVAEMYEAMQRGQADCTTGATSWLADYKLGEFVTSIVDAPINAYISSGQLLMNLDTWKGLTQEQRDIVVAELPQLSADATFAGINEARAAVEFYKKDGLTKYEPDQAFMDELQKFRDAGWTQAVAIGKKTGVKDPETVVANFRKTLTKWREIVEGTGMDKAAYTAALQREIFAKFDY